MSKIKGLYNRFVDDVKTTPKYLSRVLEVAKDCGIGAALQFDKDITKARETKVIFNKVKQDLFGRIGEAHAMALTEERNDKNVYVGYLFNQDGFHQSIKPDKVFDMSPPSPVRPKEFDTLYSEEFKNSKIGKKVMEITKEVCERERDMNEDEEAVYAKIKAIPLTETIQIVKPTQSSNIVDWLDFQNARSLNALVSGYGIGNSFSYDSKAIDTLEVGKIPEDIDSKSRYGRRLNELLEYAEQDPQSKEELLDALKQYFLLEAKEAVRITELNSKDSRLYKRVLENFLAYERL